MAARWAPLREFGGPKDGRLFGATDGRGRGGEGKGGEGRARRAPLDSPGPCPCPGSGPGPGPSPLPRPRPPGPPAPSPPWSSCPRPRRGAPPGLRQGSCPPTAGPARVTPADKEPLPRAARCRPSPSSQPQRKAPVRAREWFDKAWALEPLCSSVIIVN
ncbi:basic proline-rich protein-like [Canis lupus dingo]|uniref:basic proline-rich protein-like n=1 Tax=Canis lupus dingo TaxID=286419 RepID=UPI0020C25400|nr:basic proline-rich protein-like [Canis lupus dingo]